MHKLSLLVAERFRGPSFPYNVFQGLGSTGDLCFTHKLATKTVID